MRARLILQYLLAAVAAVALSGCLMRQTVTSNGEVLTDNYVFKRPLKNTIERSQ